MKSNLITLLFLTFIFPYSYAQITVSGIVLDAETKEALAYVNIGIIEQNTGTVSDKDGNYVLECKSNSDVILFSSIGYEPISKSASALSDSNVVTLKPIEYNLESITVESQRFDEIDRIFGVKNESRGHSIGFGSSQLGTEIGAPIKIESVAYLKSANFTINHAKGDSMIFRMNIYSFEDGEIGDNILKENIIIRAKQKKGPITVNLEDKNIIIDSDVLLSLEWISDDNGRGNVGLTFDSKKSKKPNGIYLKYNSHGKFKKIPHKLRITPCFYFIGNSVNHTK